VLAGKLGALAGVDVASDLVEAAAEANPWADYRGYEEREPIPHADSSFDLSFAICVLHHVPPGRWGAFVAEMARVTRPGGLVAIFEHNPLNPLTRLTVARCEFDEDAVLLTRRRTRRLMAEEALEIVESPYIIPVPGEGGAARTLDRALARTPLGAQYYVAGTRG
jgi:SAM-dependent methyltransferase